MKKVTVFVFILVLGWQSFLIGKEFKGAEYRTIEPVLYGRFEVSYISPFQEGVLASFFTYFTGNDSVDWASSKWNEIDIEILGRYNNNISLNTITPYESGHVRSNYVNFDPSADFHEYGFEWTPDYVAWFIDGEEVYRQTGAHVQTLIYPQKIMMNIWNPIYENWVGDWNPSVLPAFAYYDWVKYSAYTPGSGDYGTDNNFTHQWTDDFDSFDESRWTKATHTFGSNQCDFITENVVIEDGKLILCLTDDTNLGYTDKNPPNILNSRTHKNRIDLFFSEPLDIVSAEKLSNYVISGITIENAKLLEDKRTVSLTVSDLDSSKAYNLIALNIHDLWPVQNTMSGKVVPLSITSSINFPFKVNVGGSEALDFLPDQSWHLDSEYGYMEGSISEFPNASIYLTDLDLIYSTDRTGLVSYRVRVPNGLYNVKLMFSEKYFDAVGSRIFDIHVEGNLIEDNFDFITKKPKNYAFDIDVDNVEVTDEILEINLSAEIDRSIISGIVIDQSTTSINPQSILDYNNFYQLDQNYPNPFNPTTTISYSISKRSVVSLDVYDLLGNKIITLAEGIRAPGIHNLDFEASFLPSGIYFYRLLVNGNNVATKKMVVLK